MKILCITDIHGNNNKLSLIFQRESDIDLIILSGDITNLGGYKEAEKILKPLIDSNIRIKAIHGNMDKEGVARYLEEMDMSIHGKCVFVEHHTKTTIGSKEVAADIAFMGLGGSNPTPFHTPTEYSDAEVKLILKNALSEISRAKLKVFVSHAPPWNTTIDIIKSGMHAGSELVREIIKSYDIDLCISGHIHEAGGMDRIGESLCLNPGPFRQGNYAIVDIADNGINVKRRKI